MQITSAKYETSAPSVSKCPQSDKPEFAFIGRSNVGKSSLINMLTGNQKLAMTSATPGKTVLINHFLINAEWYLVDLPGYGYAKRSKKQQQQLAQMIKGYILNREQMLNLFLLIDGNITPQKIDLDFIQWLGENAVPFTLVFTKADKSRKGSFGKSVKTFLDGLTEQWEELPPHLIVSSAKRIGRQEMLDHIEHIINTVKNE
ncbi:MAG: YihA family ribosome biogenesis GTP-binding protein [Bacteroidaceae bacterium]|nr:YihA family ribosome biogenesis GTP-binding protein [Bacteroidaceae bacterium]